MGLTRSRARALWAGGAGIASWWRAGSLLDIDWLRDRVYWNGTAYQTIDEFLTAIGGSVLSGAGDSRVIRIPWTDNSIYIVAEFINPASAWASGSRYPYEIYSNDNNRMTASRNTSGMWSVAALTSGTTSFLPAGFGPIGGPIVRMAASYGATMRGAYNGADAQLSLNWPGAPVVTNLVVGGDRNGANFSSPFRRFTVYSTPVTDAAVIKADSLPIWDCWIDGDSYAGGAGNPEVGLARSLALLGWTPYTTAVGGSTLAQISARMVAGPAFAKALPAMWWDGDNNGYGTTANDLGLHQAIVNALSTSNFIIVPTAKREGQSAGAQTAVIDLTAALVSTFSDHVQPCMPYLLTLGNGSAPDNNAIANGNVPPSALQADQIHLGSPAMTGVAALTDARMRGFGWVKSA